MYPLLHDGWTLVKTLDEIKEDLGGFEYIYKNISLIQNETGEYYLRVYEDKCDSGANGRPCAYTRDFALKVNDLSEVKDRNWENMLTFVRTYEPDIVFSEKSGSSPNMVIRDYCRK